MEDCKNLNENEVVIYYEDDEVVFVHPKSVHQHLPSWSMCHYETIGMYEESVTSNLKVIGTLKTILCCGKMIHQSFIPAKGISLRVVDSKCICPNCGYMLDL